eukprot:7270431-Pyramimonas_sp.AAC.1
MSTTSISTSTTTITTAATMKSTFTSAATCTLILPTRSTTTTTTTVSTTTIQKCRTITYSTTATTFFLVSPLLRLRSPLLRRFRELPRLLPLPLGFFSRTARTNINIITTAIPTTTATSSICKYYCIGAR